MAYDFPPEIDERIQSQIALGVYSSPAEVVASALDALDERNEDLASIERGIEDERAGRVTPLQDVDTQIRAEFGIPSNG
jgi:Arc/MetJ-type ribon-helix-helix transcriptional regulator